MNSFSVFARSVIRGVSPCKTLNGRVSRKGIRSSFRCYSDERPKLHMQKCLLITKVTRYEFERSRYKDLSESRLEELIRKRGTDYDALMHFYNAQKRFEKQVADGLQEMGVEVKVVNRLTYSSDLIDWCDMVLPCGGDGTFLLAASQVKDTKKSVIGFNSDPMRSEGRLCLPKWCSKDIKGALQCLKEGRFRWLHRSRIRTTLKTDSNIARGHDQVPVDLHQPILPRYNVNKETATQPVTKKEPPRPPKENGSSVHTESKVLPYLALNEVFIGENVSARVSHLQIQINDETLLTRTKSSGLCVCTGTGSSSWHLSINCLRSQSVGDLLALAAKEYPGLDYSEEKALRLTDLYNKQLQFPPDDLRIAYSVRELITADVWPSPWGLKARGFVNSITVKSRCVDAGLVVDGGVSFPFNDGAAVHLQVLPEDCLRTVCLDET